MSQSIPGSPCQGRPIRVAVYLADQNPHRDRSLGITSMTRSLLDELGQRDNVQLTILTSSSSFGSTGRQELKCRLPFRTDRPFGRLVCDSMHPLFLRPQCDLWYYPKGYLSLLSRPSVPVVGTMHDAIIQHYADHYPQSRSARQFRYWIRVMKNSLVRLDSVMTVSENAKGQLEEFCIRQGIKPPPIHVTYESSSWEKYLGQKAAKGRAVVHLASTSPHKQTNRMLEIWRELGRLRYDLPPLRLIGRLDEHGKQLMGELKHVELSPPLDEAELVNTVQSSLALLLPSEIEGFGLPALEAYYVGTPVCYVAGTSVEEVVTKAGNFGAFELSDPASLYRALLAALNQTPDQVSSIGNLLYSRFSNARFADRVIETFSNVLGKTKLLST